MDMLENVAVVHHQVRDLTDADIQDLKQSVYGNGVVVLKNQRASAAEFVSFGRRFGTISPYYEEMYRHPEHPEIFVSSNCQADGKLVGVPRTGKFWHSDYAFMAEPFAFTITYPQVVSSVNRGTYFVDMAEAYQRLPSDLKAQLEGAVATHSVRRYFKIRPSDAYRPICEIIAEIDQKTPPIQHAAVLDHPVTGAPILYITRGFTESLTLADKSVDASAVLERLLVEVGQADETYTHPNIRTLNIAEGDIIIWDNRRFAHHAKHSDKVEATKTYRLTAYDGLPFNARATAQKRSA